MTRRVGWLPTLLADQRGVTALTFAVTFLVFLGMVGLATEVGSWYVGWIQAQNAADAAALAGARAAADANATYANANGLCTTTECGGPMQAAANSAAINAALQNGYSPGGSTGGFSFTINTPAPSSGYVNGAAGASSWLVNEIQINVAVAATYIVSLFSDILPTLSTQAVAFVNTNTPACVVSITGDLTIFSNMGFTPGCMLASNANHETAITISGAPTINLLGMTAVGSCSPLATCSSLPVGAGGVGQAFKAYQPATIIPYKPLDNLAGTPSLPTSASPSLYNLISSCTVSGFLVSGAGIPGNPTYPPAALPYAYNCPGGITISSGTLLVMPGTYYFLNTPLTINGGTIQCTDTATGGIPVSTGSCIPGNGVTFLLLVDDPTSSAGTLTIDLSAVFVSANDGSINFGSPDATTSATNNSAGLAAAMTGVLFYGNGTGAVNITGGTSAYLNGAIYFPRATVNYGSQTVPSCTVLVANTVNLNKTSQTSFAPGCDAYGTVMPKTQTANCGG